MGRRYRTWREAQVEHFKAHPEEIPLFLTIACEESAKDGNWGAFMAAVRTVAEARGGLGDLAEQLECNRPNLYRALSEEGNPRIATLGAILGALGFRITIAPQQAKTVP